MAVTKNREVGVRLSVKDDAIVRRALTELGKDGEAALKRIERAGKPASTSLLALNAAAGTVRGSMLGFSSGVLAGLAPLITATGLIAGTRAALEKFGNIADQAKSSGLDSELFQGLTYQAKLAGVEIGTLSSALDTFNKNSGQAVEGRGRMVTALKDENAELLRNLQLATSQEQRLRLIADAIRNTEDANKKAALAATAFGDAGVDLVAVFEGGSESISRAVAEARELGIVVDRETIAKADELGDKFDTVSQIIDTKLKTALVNLGPTLVWLLGLANDFIKVVDHAFQAGKPLAQQSTEALEAELTNLRKLAEAAKLSPNLQGRYFANSGGADRLHEIERELFRRADAGSMDQLGRITPPPGTPLPTLPLNEEAKKAIKDAEALIKRLRTEIEVYADTMADLQQKLDAGLITQETFNRGQAEAALKFAKAADDADEYAAALQRVEEVHREGLLTEQQYTDAVAELTKKRLVAQNDWAAGIQLGLLSIKEGAKDVATDVGNAVTGWADQLGEQIGEAARTGKFAWQDLIRTMLADLAKLATQQLITRPLAGLLGSVAGSLFGGGGGSWNIPTSFVPGGFYPGLDHNADGTDYWKGGPTWVGERGPEIVNLPRGAQVIPNHKLGGGNVTVSIVNQIDGTPNMSRGEFEALLARNNQVVIDAVPAAVKRAVAKGTFG